MYYQKLRENLFVEIDYPKAVTDVIATAEPWKNFCRLPLETKEQFTLIDQEKMDVGYQLRSSKAGREDKEYFHVRRNIQSLIDDGAFREKLENNSVPQEFFQYANAVSESAHNFALAIGREMSKEIPELAALIEQNKLFSVLRLLHYTNSDDVTVTAAQHFDRSLYTLHLYESMPGLQFLNWDMQWQDAPIDIGKTVVFSGYRMEQLTQGKIQKTWHRVVNQEGKKDRISLVLFVSTDAVPGYPQEARSQDLEPSYTKI